MVKIQVDVTDPDSIEAAVREVRTAMQRAAEEYEQLSDLLDRLRILGGYDSIKVPAAPNEGVGDGNASNPTAVDQVVAAVEAVGRPVKAREIRRLGLPEMPIKTVSWALWKAWQEDKLTK